MAEYENQFDEAQKIFVVKEMMPKDIKREFLTDYGEAGDHRQRMMADDGPTPVDLGNVGAYDAKTTR